MSALIDRAEIGVARVGISAAPRGEPGWPPLALFRAVLPATRHDLSDVKLAEALDDRASFRRFCGFAMHEGTPERTAFARFRREPVRRGLDRVLFEALTRQPGTRGVVVRTGTPVDATLIPSASIRHDAAARWAGHRRRKPLHGYKAHIATDQEAGLILGLEVTTANVHDAALLTDILPDAPGDTFGDSASSGRKAEQAIIARGGKPRTIHASVWGGPGQLAQLKARNAAISHVRCRIEQVFGTAKRSYGMRRTHWLGLAKAGLQVRLAAMAYNLRRTLTLPHAAA